MATFGNIIWFILGPGIITGAVYLLLSGLFCITIIGIPIGKALFNFAKLMAFPFGKAIIKETDLVGKDNVSGFRKVGGFIANILWLPFGVVTFIGSIGIMILCFISIIGIPVGIVIARSCKFLIWPVGAKVVTKEVAQSAQTIRMMEKQGYAKVDNGNNVSVVPVVVNNTPDGIEVNAQPYIETSSQTSNQTEAIKENVTEGFNKVVEALKSGFAKVKVAVLALIAKIKNGDSFDMEAAKIKAEKAKESIASSKIIAGISERSLDNGYKNEGARFAEERNELFESLGSTYLNDTDRSILQFSVSPQLEDNVINLEEEREQVKVQELASKGIRICASCGKELPVDSVYCSGCGSQQETMPSSIMIEYVCSSCNKPSDSEDKFCAYCGGTVNAVRKSINFSRKYKEIDNAIKQTKHEIGEAIYNSVTSKEINLDEKYMAIISSISKNLNDEHLAEKKHLARKGYRKCASCGKEITIGSAYCNVCGAPQPELEPELVWVSGICPKCSNKIGDGDNFCIKCGYKVVKD